MTAGDVLDLAAIRQRCEAATGGPWHVVGPPWNDREPYIIHGDPDPHYGGYVADLCCLSDDINAANNEQADAEFIAHSRTDLPALLAAYDRVCAERDEVERRARREALTDAWRAVNQAIRPLGTECGQSLWNAGYTQARDKAQRAILALMELPTTDRAALDVKEHLMADNPTLEPMGWLDPPNPVHSCYDEMPSPLTRADRQRRWRCSCGKVYRVQDSQLDGFHFALEREATR